MGSITPYVTAEGKRYRVRYRTPDRRQTDKRGFRTKRDAELFLANVEVSKSRGEYIEPTAGRVTVGELSTVWLGGKKLSLKPSSFEPLDASWRTHVQATWQHVPISAVRHSDVQTWLGTINRSATVVLRAHSVLAGILDLAVDDRRLARNPARGVDLPRRTSREHVYLTHEQVELLARCASAERRTLVRTLAYTGIRWGEAVGMRVKHVSRLPMRLHVAENAVQVRGIIHVGTPKGHERRSVGYPAFLATDLEALTQDRAADALLFPGPADTHLLSPDSRDGWFAGAVKRAQKIDKKFPRPRIHDLRHTAASLAISSGANVKVVQRMLGHKSAAMTLDLYGDLFTDDLDTVSERLDTARSAAIVGKVWANVGS